MERGGPLQGVEPQILLGSRSPSPVELLPLIPRGAEANLPTEHCPMCRSLSTISDRYCFEPIGLGVNASSAIQNWNSEKHFQRAPSHLRAAPGVTWHMCLAFPAWRNLLLQLHSMCRWLAHAMGRAQGGLCWLDTDLGCPGLHLSLGSFRLHVERSKYLCLLFP